MAIIQFTDTDFDFGFEFTADPQEQIAEVTSAATEASEKAQAMLNAIMPLLNNLKKNPELPNIYWPNRVDKIDQFIVKLNSIMNS